MSLVWIFLLGSFVALHVILWRYLFFSKHKIIIFLTLFDYILFSILYVFLLLLFALLLIASLPSNTSSMIHITENIFSPEECSLIISTADQAARAQGGWNTSRHKSYPTTDISADSIRDLVEVKGQQMRFDVWMNSTVSSLIYPHLSRYFDIPADRYVMQDLFIVKYESQGQNSLPIHRDSSMVTFNIALSQVGQDYEGGGTRFLLSDQEVVNVPRGSMVSHESKVYHSGDPVTSGKRYILIGFVNVSPPLLQLWWRGFGAYASCLHLPRPLSRATPRGGERMAHEYHTRCQSWLWIASFHIQEIADHLYFSFHPSLSPHHSGEVPVAVDQQPKDQRSFPYVIFLLLLALFLLLFTVVGLLLSICCCTDEFTAYHCYYPLYLLGVLTQQPQLFDSLSVFEGPQAQAQAGEAGGTAGVAQYHTREGGRYFKDSRV
jgi:predicted 2-oxoglutarate/Fe(II)-dependent dioxygenase YbiX